MDDEEPVSSTRVTLEVTLTIILCAPFIWVNVRVVSNSYDTTIHKSNTQKTPQRHKRVKLGQSLVSGSSTYPSKQ